MRRPDHRPESQPGEPRAVPGPVPGDDVDPCPGRWRGCRSRRDAPGAEPAEDIAARRRFAPENWRCRAYCGRDVLQRIRNFRVFRVWGCGLVDGELAVLAVTVTASGEGSIARSPGCRLIPAGC
jgi:hypothetical protein